MKKEDFIEELERKVAEKLEGFDHIELMEGYETNGSGCPRLVIGREGVPVSFSLRTEELYDDYARNGRTFDEVLENVYSQIDAGNLDEMADLVSRIGFGWENIKDRVYPRLINTNMNEAIIKDVPHRPFLDLSVVYYVKLEGLPDGAGGSYLVHNRQLQEMGKTEDDLYQNAIRNMKKRPAHIMDMRDVFKEMACEPPSSEEAGSFSMYVLTNNERMFGASEMINKETLEQARERLGGGFILILSSVHETLVLPRRQAPDYNEVAKMVKEVNDSAVERRDRLSYHVYEYGQDTGELRMVA